MKKVRFESPLKSYKVFEMNENECHFPRPFTERQVSSAPNLPMCENARLVPYDPDPVHRHDYGNSSPYPNVCKMQVNNVMDLKTIIAPTNDLELSILDASNSGNNNMCTPQQMQNKMYSRKPLCELKKHLNENTNEGFIPNILNKTDDFFLRKENLSKMHSQDAFYSQLNKLSLDKENSPQSMKTELINKLRHDSQIPSEKNIVQKNQGCQGCQFRYQSCMQSSTPHLLFRNQCVQNVNPCLEPDIINYYNQPCFCKKQSCHSQTQPKSPRKVPENFVDKRNWVVEKLEQANKECAPISSLNDKVKREPTVSDLFKIIKLQNEQLQMLQQKVDLLISEKQEPKPVTQYITSTVALQAVEEQKMSIGVMTSFEMVRTSTIINKEIVTQNEAQIQCNRSQISIKEVVSKCQPKEINFLDGIPTKNDKEAKSIDVQEINKNVTKDTECERDDKTYNELSLYNVQVDNATTPNMSPEQSLYLDVRDYSDSDSGSEEQSNVGWTYYNKVMTHVNGLLHESDMPSSASAQFRNTRQKCLQMQIDKTNVSIAKRVTFGDDPLGMQQQNLNAMTDTSLKMNQLAAKYLKSRPVFTKSPSPKPLTAGPNEMSYATKNYMEKHKLLQGTQAYKLGVEIPKFLDITALKQQPKLL